MSYFIGSMVPDEVRKVLLNNRPDIDEVRWVIPEKYHITFEHFPDLSNELFNTVHHRVQSLTQYFPLRCEAKCFSGFPTYRKARVVITLITFVETDIYSVVDAKRFTPHVTLGYARNQKVFVPKSTVQCQFSFDHPALFRSENGIYTEIKTNRQ